MDNITNFLYLIGSVFAPMIAIQIADFFLLEEDHSEKRNPDFQYGTVGDRLYLVPDPDENRHPGRQYTAGYCDHGGTVSDLGKNQ